MNVRTLSPITRRSTTAVMLAGTLFAAAACGGSDSDSASDGESGGDPELSAMVPEAIKEKGTLTVAAAVYAPAVMEPTDGGDVTGWDIEVTRQAAELLGLKVDYTIIPFDGVIPGLQAGRYDAATGEINVTDERTEVVTFVTNHTSKDEFIVPADSDVESFDEPADVCGLVIGAALGSSEAATAEDMAAECKKMGGEKTSVKTFQTQAQVNLALGQGRLDASLASGSQAAFSVDETDGEFKLAKLGFGPQIETGLALPRNENTDELAAAFQAATEKMIEDGSLEKILNDLNGGLGMVEKSEIIPAPSS